jgi:hypothetical protein
MIYPMNKALEIVDSEEGIVGEMSIEISKG